MPFFTYWKDIIKPGVSDAMISQLDLFSSIAALVNSKERAEDSEQLIDLLMGKSKNGRNEMVIEATSRTAFRKGDWVMIPPYQGPEVNRLVNIELGNCDIYQLYNLKEDIKQQKNLAKTNSKKLKELITDFETIRGKENTNIEQLELK